MTETRCAILRALEVLTDRYPDMRFGQLVCNIANWATRQPDALWDLEDEDAHLTRVGAGAENPNRNKQ